MAQDPFRDGDKITIERQGGAWKVAMQTGKGIVGPAFGAVYATPEEALSALRAQAAQLARQLFASSVFLQKLFQPVHGSNG